MNNLPSPVKLCLCRSVFYHIRWHHCWLRVFQRKRPESASLLSSVKSHPVAASTSNANNNSTCVSNVTLTGEEIRILRRAREEHSRRGGWVRIFPSSSSWDTYRWLSSSAGFCFRCFDTGMVRRQHTHRDSLEGSIKERKSIYIAPLILRIVSKRSGMDHTVLLANYTMPVFSL